MRRRPIKIILAIVLAVVFSLSGCSAPNQREEIVILYTNDVHCAVDEAIGYGGLSAYKKKMEARTPYVTLVDCGDALQGDAIGTVSQGEYLVDIMNRAGYDFAVLGNHEFDYGMEQLEKLMDKADAQYLGCNIRYTGDGESIVDRLKPYEIVAYGDVKVAFIGISTPESIVKSTPAYFMDASGRLVYDFFGETGEMFYACVQKTVDECRQAGADYVIALAHLGDDEASAPFRSVDLIAETSGIDVLLDGHSHSVISCYMVENKLGEDVILSSTGTGLTNIGQVIITENGIIAAGLIGAYPQKDEEMAAYLRQVQDQYEAALSQPAGHTEVSLTTESETGQRLVRSRETNMGDFCADAYREIAGADIAFVNGGGIRADLKAGEITYGDIIAVQPYGNRLCVAEVAGQEILDALEMASRSTMPQAGDGENGGFLQVSGLRYTIDTSVESTVVTDETGMFVSCGSSRRVKDVEVLQKDGSYVPILADGTYTLASHDYLIKQGGDGLNMFMDQPLILEEGMLDYQVLITYISDHLGGNVGSEYAETQGRITIEG